MPYSLLLTMQFWSGFGRAKGWGLGHRELWGGGAGVMRGNLPANTIKEKVD